jgi:hypothetical protein
MSHFIVPVPEDYFMIGIKKVSNGFIVQQVEGTIGTTDIPKIEEVVFEEKEDIINDEHDLDKMIELLYYIKEYLGCRYSKHNEKNIVIKVEGENEDV